MFAGIHRLPPAHLLAADRTGTATRAYWDPAAAASRPSRLDSPTALRDALLRAVERELMSDVPVGVFTSGGPHSSLLPPRAARPMAGAQVPTVAVLFVATGVVRRPFAQDITHPIRTDHPVL